MDMMQLGFVLGLDNVAVALALGPLVLSARRTALLAVLFGASEALMPLAGSAFAAVGGFAPVGEAGEAVRVTVLATLATMVLGLTLVRRDPAALVGHPAMLVALAILLGLDNFTAGATGSRGRLRPRDIRAGERRARVRRVPRIRRRRPAVARRSLPLASTVMLAALAVAGLV